MACWLPKIASQWFTWSVFIAHTIHVWSIYLHLVDFCGKCRYIYHTDLMGCNSLEPPAIILILLEIPDDTSYGVTLAMAEILQ